MVASGRNCKVALEVSLGCWRQIWRKRGGVDIFDILNIKFKYKQHMNVLITY